MRKGTNGPQLGCLRCSTAVLLGLAVLLALAAIVASCRSTERRHASSSGSGGSASPGWMRGHVAAGAAAGEHPRAVAWDAAPGSVLPSPTPDAVSSPPWRDWFIAWPPERAEMMLAYRRRHSEADAQDLTITPVAIVLHYTAGSSAAATKHYFDNLTIEPARKKLYAGGTVNVSAHFLVDRDGTIYRLMPETVYARHCIGLNHNSIGVENVGDEAKWPLTEAQVAANAKLVRHLAQQYPVRFLLGHHEVMGLTESALFLEREADFRNRKPDPGARFMKAVRAQLADLGLADATTAAAAATPR